MKWFTFVWQPVPYFLCKVTPGPFFVPFGARAFFSLGSEILHTSDDGGIYWYYNHKLDYIGTFFQEKSQSAPVSWSHALWRVPVVGVLWPCPVQAVESVSNQRMWFQGTFSETTVSPSRSSEFVWIFSKESGIKGSELERGTNLKCHFRILHLTIDNLQMIAVENWKLEKLDCLGSKWWRYGHQKQTQASPCLRWNPVKLRGDHWDSTNNNGIVGRFWA